MSRLHATLAGDRPRDVARRGAVIAAIAFFTLVDLFAAQALVGQLTEAMDAPPSLVGLAVNASTLGMAPAGLLVAWRADRIDRARGIWLSLALLALPTAVLGFVTDVWLFMALRIVQGVLMATAFTLTMTYLSERCDKTAALAGTAAYITGNVASNLVGRLLAVWLAGGFGLGSTFIAFAALNLAGALLAYLVIGARDLRAPEAGEAALRAWAGHLANPRLRIAFMLGFAILFVFVATYTYVNFLLTGPFALTTAQLGAVYLVFVPAMLTTPFASGAVARLGARRVFQTSMLVAAAGMGLTLLPSLAVVLAGLAVIGAATFFAQAAATGFVGTAAERSRGAANGLYLTSYYLGGLGGAFAMGQVFAAGGWTAVALVLTLVLLGGAALATRLK